MTREPYWAQVSSLLRFRYHTQRHTLQESLGGVISSSQKPLPDKTQTSNQTDIYVPGGIRIRNSQQASCRRPYALDRAASVIGLTPYTPTFILTTVSVERFFHFSVVSLKNRKIMQFSWQQNASCFVFDIMCFSYFLWLLKC